MRLFAAKNWPGVISIVIAVLAIAAYVTSVLSGSAPIYLGKVGPLFGDLFQLGTTLSLVVGIAAVVRARRGGGGLVTAIIGLVLGGTLTVLWVGWIGVLVILNPAGLGG